MDNLFINALVRAGLCKDHAPPSGQTSYLVSEASRNRQSHRGTLSSTTSTIRQYHGRSSCQQDARAQLADSSRDDFLKLVDFYYEPSGPDIPLACTKVPTVLLKDPAATEAQEPPGPLILDNEAERRTLHCLAEALAPDTGSNDEIFKLYKALPSPGVAYIPQHLIRLLLHRLSVVEKKNESSMLRYLTIMDDMKASGIPLTLGEWNSAISFTGRCFSKVSRVEVESALYLWKEMENDAGLKGNHVTFNILFDVAVKAGKFVLAEMILKEMRARDIDSNRYGRVGLIFYYGYRGDGNGVRSAYKQLVEGGEIVDTAVLNCVIASLFRAGESPAAELVYERMKSLQASRMHKDLPPRDWRARRSLGKQLQRAAIGVKKDHGSPQSIQENTAMAPDLNTYRILIKHHVHSTGNLESVTSLLDEMRHYEVSVDGSIFLLLLRGFCNQGGVRYTSWTASLLEEVWSACLDSVDKKASQIYMGKFMAIWSLRAFAKCSGKARTLEVWDEINAKWHSPEADLKVVKGVLSSILGE
ncbi:MAG: hypothetical protein M1837_006023 [Sclerophora amabilis]|nr:MAG: hypothetical protein M1837_006023 [Sclerophora amabilis]